MRKYPKKININDAAPTKQPVILFYTESDLCRCWNSDPHWQVNHCLNLRLPCLYCYPVAVRRVRDRHQRESVSKMSWQTSLCEPCLNVRTWHQSWNKLTCKYSLHHCHHFGYKMKEDIPVKHIYWGMQLTENLSVRGAGVWHPGHRAGVESVHASSVCMCVNSYFLHFLLTRVVTGSWCSFPVCRCLQGSKVTVVTSICPLTVTAVTLQPLYPAPTHKTLPLTHFHIFYSGFIILLSACTT